MAEQDRIPAPSAALISLLKRCRTASQALQIQAQILVKGLQTNQFLLSKLASFFARSDSPSSLRHSRRLLPLLHKPDTFFLNTMIRRHSRSGSPEEALAVFKSMASPNNFTFPFLLASCARIPSPHAGLSVHAKVLKSGFDSDLFVFNSLLHFYCAFDDLRRARALFDQMPERDAVSYNTIISGFVRAGRAAEALSLFKEMGNPDACTFVVLLSLCSSMADLPTGRLLHQRTYRRLGGAASNLRLKNAVVNLYARCEEMAAARRAFGLLGDGEVSIQAVSCMVYGYASCGEAETARKMFDGMPVKDPIAWTALIGGYLRGGRQGEAMELFLEMEASGSEPDDITIAVALSACAQTGSAEMAELLRRRADRKTWRRNPFLATALVDAYAKCGLLAEAADVFGEVEVQLRTVPLFNAMVSGFAQHGLGIEALATFRQMAELGLRPDETSFTALLSACSHSGLVKEGKQIFNSMPFRPQIEHYGCLVDLLCRGGFVKEALEFIKEMPLEQNSVIWHSLLAACKIHGETGVGDEAARRLLQLGMDGGSCVLLSGMLADAKRWEDSAQVRRQLQKKTRKAPGWSCL